MCLMMGHCSPHNQPSATRPSPAPASPSTLRTMVPAESSQAPASAPIRTVAMTGGVENQPLASWLPEASRPGMTC